MTLGEFLEGAWRDHGAQPEAVAARLADALPLVRETSDFAPFTRLLTHVYGEHLGKWGRGVQLLDALRHLPAFDHSAIAVGPVTRGIAMLRVASGEHSALDGLSDDDRAYALAAAADALAARNQVPAAIAAFGEALDAVPPVLATDHPAIRALAVGGNNLATALEGRVDLSPAEEGAMLTAAEAGLRYWKLAGTWLEHERAEYQLSRCHLRAGNLAEARAGIERCIDVCIRNNAPSFELFFGYAVRALADRMAGDLDGYAAHRRVALEHYARVPEQERHWCEREFREIGD